MHKCCSVNEIAKSPPSSPTLRHKRPRPSSSRSRTPEIVSTVSTLPFVAAAAAAFTAFTVTNSTANSTTRTSSPSRSISPTPTSVSRTHSPAHHRDNENSTTDRDEAQQEAEISAKSRNVEQQRRSDSSEDGTSSHNRISNSNSNHGNIATSSERDDRARSRRRARASSREAASSSTVFSVIYDIACCDGPVRFHRVLNENYSSATSAHGSGAQPRPQRNCQVTAESEDPSSENDENGGPASGRRSGLARSPSNDSSNDASNANNGGCYTCGYCKHTFKSQYCYRKHAKRHLLPPTRVNETTSDSGDGGSRQEAVAATAATAAAAAAAHGNRREVRLLDLNVQYYPCKICGCKFPSYYFVHKHRKLCHANDEERQVVTDGTIASNRDVNVSSPQDAP
ncbi:hypothetical protein EAG_15375 [Camponotus floridanus]|uniref:C2H2-type domain-containing protein n=1 Tax=Camponotus floridanus TaxID=104421 RepID=E2AKE3_CAMFO|nr:hypothetical protein EAG_15375 [Camponotus floridanus]